MIELPVSKLKVGFYVSRLDRPWTETPFPFQGFEIESEEDLAQLRSLCNSVHVELSAAEAQAYASRQPHPVEAPKKRADPLSDLSLLIDEQSRGGPEKNPVPLKTELVKAKVVFGEAKKAVNDIFRRIRLGSGLDVTLLDTAMDSMVESVFRNRDALSWLACMKRKDDYLYNHSLSSSVWALAFGRHLGLDKDAIRIIGIGAMLLDIGKTSLPDGLLKSNAALGPEDWNAMRTHVDKGVQLVQVEPMVDKRVLSMIATHHERMDGSGYPHQLKGDAIPLVGRIAGIVDCYDAMTSSRPHAKGKSTHEAVLELKKLGGTWFQTELIELFIQAVGVFPSGTLVELNTGEIGVVVSQNRFRRLRPEVMMILDAQKKLRDDFVVVDLQFREQTSASGEALWITKALEPGAYDIDPTEYFL
ncbi:MAG: HD-GYP domain-containing protein [Pseudomonadota bacterium]|nr:HD-GYP domain-containing protein [Pseudomonadota bacterium]